MKKFVIFFTLLFCTINIGYSQDKPYFQQKVDYAINVTLNDSLHRLQGDIDISYTNNSSDDLNFIYFHLWPNAYKNEGTAFAKQAQENGAATSFFYVEEGDRGFIDGLDFLVDGNSATWDYDPDNIDIAILNLDKPLKSGQTIEISTPFEVKIPQSFSRLGHVGQSYQMTQWYPKPAVYDHKGWHPMPYLNQGEFFSEFGDFDVTITLPENYVVGATGELQTKTELEFLNRKVMETNKKAFKTYYGEKEVQQEFPLSAEQMKTIHYKASNVHDFAWFADKRFYVKKDQIELASGKKVDTWVMFTDFEANLWKNAIGYVNRSVKFYSDEVGEYPYPQATAVQSALSAGGGMEYPMITVIGRSGNAHDLDIVITHEVGHNWFYGILASDERTHPWMDEGMNSFYEKKYNAKYYGQVDSLNNFLPRFMTKALGAEDAELGYVGYLYKARKQETQAIETPSQDLTSINYFLSAYDRPAIALKYLEHYLGEETFKGIMQKYYETWKFQHPYPEDFRKLFEAETKKDLSWFFDGILGFDGEKTIDYAVKGKTKTNVTVINKSLVDGPFSLSIIKDGQIVATEWHEGFSGSKVIDLPAGEHDEIRLDAIEVIPEINRENNGQKRPLKLGYLASIENPKHLKFNIVPMIGFNNYDKVMVGAAFHNLNLIPQKFDYVVAPMYSMGATDLVGLADFRYNHYIKNGPFKRISHGVGLKSFSFLKNKALEYHEKYIRVVPSIEAEFRKKRPRSLVSQSLRFEVPLIWDKNGQLKREERVEMGDTTFVSVFDGFEYKPLFGGVLSYQYKKKGLHPLQLNPMIEYRSHQYSPREETVGYLKVSLTGTFKFHYLPKRALKVRFYAAAVPFNNQNKNWSASIDPINLVSNGSADYFYDDYYIGRNQGRSLYHEENITSQQINPNREGGIRAPLPGGSTFGRTDIAAASINLTFDLPFRGINFPARPFIDMAYYATGDDPSGLKSPIVINGGIAVELGQALGIYIPLFSTKNLSNEYKQLGGFFNHIGFKIDLHQVNPKTILKNFDL